MILIKNCLFIKQNVLSIIRLGNILYVECTRGQEKVAFHSAAEAQAELNRIYLDRCQND